MTIGLLKLDDKDIIDMFGNDKYFKQLLESVEGQPDQELICKVSMEVMKDPVILSSGLILDRVSVFNDEGNMRFKVCPLTREKLDSKVYPV